ncbi:hypothetical protein Tco_0746687 [Tanacetum coccineum]
MPYPRFTKIIINHFISQNKSISMRNMINLHKARDDRLLGTLKYVFKTDEHRVYGALIPKEMLNEDILNSTAYKTYYAYASGAKEPNKARKFKKHASPKLKTIPVSPKEPTKKPAKNLEPAKKAKTPAKGKRSKGIEILSDVALTEAAQLKEISGTDEGTGDSGEEDDDNDDDDDDNDDNGNDNDDDGNDDGDNDDNDDDSNHKRTESDKDENPNLNLSSTQDDDKEEESERVYTPPELVPTNDEEKIDDEEQMDEEEDDKVIKELYKDVNMNLGNKDADMTNANQGGADQHNKTEGPMKSSSVSSDFIEKLLNFENISPTENEIASLMDAIVHHEESSDQISSLFTALIMVIPEITSTFTTTIPPQHPFFNPLPQQATSTPTPTASEVTTSFPTLPDFASVFRFNERVANLEKDLSEMKQVDQYTQAISSIPAIVDHYIDNKQREAIQQVIQSHIAECREEALADKREYIDLINTSMRAIIKEELNVTESLKAAVLAKSSSQPKSTYEAAASLSEFELTKILMDKMEEHKSYFRVDYKRELYDALVKSYNTDKDLFDTYGEVFTLKRSRDNKDKD